MEVNDIDLVNRELSKTNYGRVFNFSAGPSMLPVSVLEEARDQLLNWKGSGKSVMEMSHRSQEFEEIIFEIETQLRTLLGIPKDYQVLFLQGGGSLQFSMIPLNFLKEKEIADYIITGTWGEKAFECASQVGKTRVIYSSKSSNYDHVPDCTTLKFSDHASYVHLTSNETIQGVDFLDDPQIRLPLVADMSSNILSRPIEISRYSLIYASAQKNMGPAGVTIVIIRDDFLEKASCLHPMLSYKIHAENKSIYNTPPCWSIYICGLMYRWYLEEGGLEAIYERNQEKAKMIYDTIDQSNGFYTPYARVDCRSLTNIVFNLPNAGLTESFIEKAMAEGLDGLQGHSSLGGCRASIYNAFPLEGCIYLADFMKNFAEIS